jgi:hypothetical protein
MKELYNNPKNRCCLCNGREVVYEVGGEEYSNLEKKGSEYYCKDEKECEQNRMSEGTIVHFGLSEEGKLMGVTIKTPDYEVMSVERVRE